MSNKNMFIRYNETKDRFDVLLQIPELEKITLWKGFKTLGEARSFVENGGMNPRFKPEPESSEEI